MTVATTGSYLRPHAGVPRAPEGMVGGPVATLVMTNLPVRPLPRRARRAAADPGLFTLRCGRVPFSIGTVGLAAWTPPAPAMAFASVASPGVTLSAGGGRLAADRVPGLCVVAALPADADSVTIQPHAGSAILAIAVRDSRGVHSVPLRCADLLRGCWHLGADRFGRACWQSGEARLRLPPLQGAASVELTLIAL